MGALVKSCHSSPDNRVSCRTRGSRVRSEVEVVGWAAGGCKWGNLDRAAVAALLRGIFDVVARVFALAKSAKGFSRIAMGFVG